VDRSELAVGPRRQAMTDPPRILIDGVTQNCNGCHQIFQSSSPAGTVLDYHQDITLNHGLNNRCVNCHDADDRQVLTLRDGTIVPFSQTPRLCSQCHGTVFRDWERGTHGKTLGSWRTHTDGQRRLDCNECHNPHSPRYEPYQPLPGPNTLRMGEQRSPEHPSEHPREPRRSSPLQQWLHADPHSTVPHSPSRGEHP
jgi:hypothetical protein